MKNNKTELIEAELERIRARDGGVLNPAAVVEVASDPESVLHTQFQWDDTKAAQAYRIWQARQLISMVVTVLPHENKPVRMYVSLRDDRDPAGGYRGLADVMGDTDMRRALLREAFSELNRLKQKYNQLSELTPVFAAAEIAERDELAAVGT
jgi:hypothetical protein